MAFFFVLATISVKVIPEKGSEDNPVIHIEARFELQYKLPKKFTASLEELNAFAEINGIFNAWPYWREFVQSTSSRMNLPPLTLPIFRVADEIGQLKREKELEDEKVKKK